jgi:hypothetical protein
MDFSPLTFSNSTFCPHSVFMCFVWVSEQTAIISLYSINWLVCITETECVYCAVRPGSLNKSRFYSSFEQLIAVLWDHLRRTVEKLSNEYTVVRICTSSYLPNPFFFVFPLISLSKHLEDMRIAKHFFAIRIKQHIAYVFPVSNAVNKVCSNQVRSKGMRPLWRTRRGCRIIFQLLHLSFMFPAVGPVEGFRTSRVSALSNFQTETTNVVPSFQAVSRRSFRHSPIPHATSHLVANPFLRTGQLLL